jgi:hypothetical protein
VARAPDVAGIDAAHAERHRRGRRHHLRAFAAGALTVTEFEALVSGDREPCPVRPPVNMHHANDLLSQGATLQSVAHLLRRSFFV